MRIDTIEIENFRGFDVYRRDLGPGLNVLVGENGAGKSALLDALAVGVGSFFLGVDGASGRAIKRDDVRLVPRPAPRRRDGRPTEGTSVSRKGRASHGTDRRAPRGGRLSRSGPSIHTIGRLAYRVQSQPSRGDVAEGEEDGDE